jgi:hypothetical protein
MTLISLNKKIQSIVGILFDDTILDFIGFRPTFQKEGKSIVFSFKENSLSSIFLDALGEDTPNKVEEAALKARLGIAKDYMESVKENTQARISNSISTYMTLNNISEDSISLDNIKNIITKELDVARQKIEVVINAESKTARNVATALQIAKFAKVNEIDKPVVFYNVTLDERTAEQPEKNVHLITGTSTPRLFYLDELSYDYWKKGMKTPSIHGGHVNCRCQLTVLSPGFGFDEKGKIKFVSLDYDAISEQRKTHPID